MFTTINITLCIFLTIMVYVLIGRKLVAGNIDNLNGAIIPIVLVISLIGLICSYIACAESVKLDLMYMTMSSDDISQTKNHNIILLAIGYASLSFNYIMLKIIEKKIKKEQPKQGSHWDWNKLK